MDQSWFSFLVLNYIRVVNSILREIWEVSTNCAYSNKCMRHLSVTKWRTELQRNGGGGHVVVSTSHCNLFLRRHTLSSTLHATVMIKCKHHISIPLQSFRLCGQVRIQLLSHLGKFSVSESHWLILRSLDQFEWNPISNFVTFLHCTLAQFS